MDFSACVKFATEKPVTCVASTDDDQPRVRAFALWFCDSSGFYYPTGTLKNTYGQLKKNPKVELCISQPGEGAGMMMRVAGKVSSWNDKALPERLFSDRPRMKDLPASAPKDGEVAILRSAHGEACFRTMADNLRENEAPRVKF